VADGEIEQFRAMVDEKISQSGAAKMAALEHDDEDDFDEEIPTRLASPELSALARAATEAHEAKLRDAQAKPTPSPAGPPADTPKPMAMPEPMAKRQEPVAPAATPEPPAAKPAPPAAISAPSAEPARPGPAPLALGASPDDDGDLMEMLQKQKRKDMVMYAIAAILFAIGVAVLILNRLS
jgi:hypothetical protein